MLLTTKNNSNPFDEGQQAFKLQQERPHFALLDGIKNRRFDGVMIQS